MNWEFVISCSEKMFGHVQSQLPLQSSISASSSKLCISNPSFKGSKKNCRMAPCLDCTVNIQLWSREFPLILIGFERQCVVWRCLAAIECFGLVDRVFSINMRSLPYPTVDTNRKMTNFQCG